MSGDDSSHPAPRAAGHDVDGDPLPTASVNRPAPRARTGDDYPRHIENYRIIRRLGAGGMGVVFEAEQENPRRLVALKLINAGVASRDALRRFQHEATVLGRLQHAGIAQIYEAGTFDEGDGGRPFFAMELVRGQPITDFAAARNLGRDQRLELLAKVCDAVQHAHLKAIIHRDLKPGNILVTAEGQPKVLDFGVARATDADVRATTLQTRADQLIGTLPYMSPEQALGDSNELDVRSDVYALGVIGYELLTGRLPYDVDRRTVFEAVRVIREEEPTRLSAIDRSLRGDVETIFAKSLEKDRNRRYQSAADLASDAICTKRSCASSAPHTPRHWCARTTTRSRCRTPANSRRSKKCSAQSSSKGAAASARPIPMCWWRCATWRFCNMFAASCPKRSDC